MFMEYHSAILFGIVVLLSKSTDAVFQPSIATVHPGESPVFSCFSQNANVDIQFKAAVGSTDPVLIYSTIRGKVDSKYAEEYTMTVSSGNYDLTVLNASSADAGTYKCESDSGPETAELVVIEPGPSKCLSTVSNISFTDGCGVEFRLECNVVYHGNVPPNIEIWRSLGQEKFGPFSVSENSIVSNVAKHSLVQRLFSNSSGSHFLCKTGTENGRKSTAEPICTSEEISISCASSSIVPVGGRSVAVIVGPIVGGIIFTLGILFLTIYVMRRRKKLQRQPDINQEPRNTNGTSQQHDEIVSLLEVAPPYELLSVVSQVPNNKLRLIELLADGGYYEIHKAEHEDFGIVSFTKQCVEHMDEEYLQLFIQEAEIPMRLSHQNIVKVLGIISDNAPTGMTGLHGIVYEYLENGDLNDFLDMFPLEWSYKLSLLSDVASGMNYLHSQTPPIIHGDLRTEYVLIGYNFKAKVSEFSFVQLKSYSQSYSKRKVGHETVVHCPPEFISGSSTTEKSEPFDVYSFGILVWETITQQKPFSRVSSTTIVSKWVQNGERPDVSMIPGNVSPACKSLMEACWFQEIDGRPTFNDIETKLQNELALIKIKHISSDSLKEMKCLPDGGYLEGFRATHPTIGEVVYKELSLSGMLAADITTLQTEANILLHLTHPNLIKLMAIVTDKTGSIGLIYPFYNDGNLLQYLRKTKLPWMKRLSLLHDVACGMRFMHGQTPVIIHGDLKMENVLVSIVRGLPIAMICDFGLPQWKSSSTAASSDDNLQFGNPAITPPENLSDSDHPKTTLYDVYSFGILMYQTMTLQKPYTVTNTILLASWVINGKRPALENIPKDLCVSQQSFDLMKRCWSSEKADRPDFQRIIEDLRREIQSRNLCSEKNVREIEHSELKYGIKKEKPVGHFLIATADHGTFGKVTVKKPRMKAMTFRDQVRLVEDASSYQQLDHRNILKMHGLVHSEQSYTGELIGIQSRIYGIVFEHAGDQNLNEYLRANKPPWDQKLPLLYGVASGMAYLHSCTPEVTHGDLKMENVFVREDGGSVIAKVCNFGFSLATERNPAGTIAHIPPENLKNPHHPKLEAFDVYGFAVLMWQTMTEKQILPFAKRAPGKTVYEFVLQDDLRPDLQFVSKDVSQTSIDLMKRCWSTSKTDRPLFKGIAEELKRDMQSSHPSLNNNNSSSNNNSSNNNNNMLNDR